MTEVACEVLDYIDWVWEQEEPKAERVPLLRLPNGQSMYVTQQALERAEQRIWPGRPKDAVLRACSGWCVTPSLWSVHRMRCIS